jgi:SAM-dependent methyltransferase
LPRPRAEREGVLIGPGRLLVKARGLASIARSAARDRGIRFVIGRGADYAISFWAAHYYGRRPPRETFDVLGRSYRYFYHLYNITWKNERAVEIAVARDFVEHHPSDQVLEVGNVLSWYGPVRHDVLDKYEVMRGVINDDIIDFEPGHRYDAIVAISTMEHVGWDETPRDPTKVLRAIDHLKRLLAPGGRMLITAPLGYNAALDAALGDGTLRFTRQSFMKRVGRTRWREASWEEVKDLAYVTDGGATGLLIAVHDQPESPALVAES